MEKEKKNTMCVVIDVEGLAEKENMKKRQEA